MTGLSARRFALTSLLLLLIATPPAVARTIVITDEDCDKIAVISSETPRLSWANYESSNGVFTTYVIQMLSTRSLLIQYPLDMIPRGQRITSAEWEIPVSYIAGTNPRFQLRRILCDWGAGVCHTYRLTHPKKVKWAKAGARGISSDVALKPTSTMKVTAVGKVTFTVTEDVELWYRGGAVNHGWIMTLLDEGTTIQLPCPVSPWVPGQGQFKLRITYEPK
jgi:hypothetical protein